jgi:hypothetical protein
LVIDIVDVRKKRTDTFSNGRLEIEEAFPKFVNSLSCTLIVMEKKLRPYLARRTSVE